MSFSHLERGQSSQNTVIPENRAAQSRESAEIAGCCCVHTAELAKCCGTHMKGCPAQRKCRDKGVPLHTQGAASSGEDVELASMIMHGNRDTPPGESVVMLTLRAFPLKPG